MCDTTRQPPDRLQPRRLLQAPTGKGDIGEILKHYHRALHPAAFSVNRPHCPVQGLAVLAGGGAFDLKTLALSVKQLGEQGADVAAPFRRSQFGECPRSPMGGETPRAPRKWNSWTGSSPSSRRTQARQLRTSERMKTATLPANVILQLRHSYSLLCAGTVPKGTSSRHIQYLGFSQNENPRYLLPDSRLGPL